MKIKRKVLEQLNPVEGVMLLADFEKEVTKLYQTLSDKCEDQQVKSFFQTLATTEEQHASVFDSIINSISSDYGGAAVVHETEYQETIIKYHHVYDKAVKHNFNRKAALKFAQKIERDTISFANQLIEVFPDLPRDQLDNLISEETALLSRIKELSPKAEVWNIDKDYQ